MENNLGKTVLTLDTKLKDVFYKVTKVYTDNSGLWQLELEGKTTKEILKYPLLFFEKKFKVVPESTVEIMFPNKEKNNGSETKSP